MKMNRSANRYSARMAQVPARLRATTLAVMACLPAGAVFGATEFDWGDAKGTFKADVTLGTQMRTTSADPQLVNNVNAKSVGLSGNTNGTVARNNDDGNLNFGNASTTSSVVKVLADLQVKGKEFEAVLKAKAWYDFTLKDSAMPYGNMPNHYLAGTPLSDDGADQAARFSGISLLDAYVKTNIALGGQTGDVRLGNQVLQGWGERFSLGGGLSSVSPRDLAAAVRPGALPGEIPVRMPMLQGKLASGGFGSLEGFLQLGQRTNVAPLCGTYFSTADFAAEGCNRVYLLPAATDGVSDQKGYFLKRAEDQRGKEVGQFGLAYRWQVESMKTGFSLNYADYSSRSPVIGGIKSTNNATPVIPNDPAGSNAKYFADYPENVRVLGFGFDRQLSSGSLSGELTFRPSQPIGLNGSDVLNAFASNTALTQLRQDVINTAPGGSFLAYDRFKVWQGQLAATRPFDGVLGSQAMTLSGEVGMRYVADLPDVAVRRYGRSTMFGLGPVAGACTGSAVQCSSDGFVSTTAWGYRLRGGLRYTDLLPGVDFTPTLSLGHDVKGWSDDGVFSEGRRTVNLSLRAMMKKKYWVDLTAQSTWGGTYDTLQDRGFVNLSIGAAF